VKNVDPVTTQQYIEKADHFFQAMKLAADDVASYRSGIALLAVHSAISLNDAITSGMTGKKNKQQDHSVAVTGLEKIAKRRRIADLKGVGHFRWLLLEKSKIAYGRERLDDALIRLSVAPSRKVPIVGIQLLQGYSSCPSTLASNNNTLV
jgi:hypothetical protein